MLVADQHDKNHTCMHRDEDDDEWDDEDRDS